MANLLTYLICFSALLGLSFCFSLTVANDDEAGSKSEKELRAHLFRDYDKLVRPIKDHRKIITASVSISPLRIRELNAKDQLLVLETFTLMEWNDDYLKWEPEHFGNISILRVPATEVWRPDLAVYTSPEQSQMFPEPATNVLLYDSGKVLWVPMYTIRSKCPLVKSKKTVTCTIKIGSWTFSELSLDVKLKTKSVELSDYRDTNPDWKLAEVSSERIETYYDCCKEAYPSLNFNVTLKRRMTEGVFTNDEQPTTAGDYDFEQ